MRNALIALLLFVTVALALGAGPTAAEPKPVALFVHASESFDKPEPLRLSGADDKRQLLVTGKLQTGQLHDLTGAVTYTASPEGIVSIDKSGRVTPLNDGSAVISARLGDGLVATLPVTVTNAKITPPVNFANQIVPVFTKHGCNGGGCHGKSGGQNGFKLSLLGFEPAEDYEHLVKEARGRRLFPGAPERSLLLTKGAAVLPHGGGQRLQIGSDDYNLIVRWIQQGMPYGNASDPVVTRIEVLPRQRIMPLQEQQQLVVLAHYSNGSIQDVTRSALYEPNDKNLGAADEGGMVKVFNQPGDVAFMVRYQAKVAVFRATVPLGAPVEKLPPAKNFIDEIVFSKLKAVGMPPSDVADDATFIRRVTLDIAGRLPTPEETTAFLASTASNKRDQWIEHLVDSTDYADHFANKWSSLLRNKRNNPADMRGTYAFHTWIRDSLLINKPFNQFARDIIAASGELAENPAVAWYRQVRDPKQQLEDTAQLFLGMRLQCAQCHHHPFEKWSQQDYYSFSAFFSTVGRKPSGRPGEEMIFHRRANPSATNPKTKQPVGPAGLGTDPLPASPEEDPRQLLADWMTSAGNPFFAKSLVNRYWKHFFGRGLVDPEDDMRETNPPSNPELLDALAQNFVASGYDLKQLVRTITRSSVYQLSAIPNSHNAIDRQYFSRYFPKRLTAEVLLDSVNGVLKAEEKFDGLPAGTRAVQLPDNSFNANSYFLQVFGRPESSSACECERSQDASLAQSLHLLNSKTLQEKLSGPQGRAAALAADARGDEEKIREAYLLAYSRQPDPGELALAKSYLARKLQQKDKDGKQDLPALKKQAYEDILWALINTKEFAFNH